MAGTSLYTVVLDACVLYPAPVRDILLSLAEALKAIKAQRQRLVKPVQSPTEFLATLERCGLPQTASLLAENIELI